FVDYNLYFLPDLTGFYSLMGYSEFYHFSVSRFDSVDGKRHYEVWIGVSDKKAPVSGFPVLYMLDGNTVMDRLSDEFLKNI
ncbi:Salmochelin siderophore protein IroE, partial [Salmonella enterica]|nr:Salmochelin siderophore protein IroE [Salmonella enterica]